MHNLYTSENVLILIINTFFYVPYKEKIFDKMKINSYKFLTWNYKRITSQNGQTRF